MVDIPRWLWRVLPLYVLITAQGINSNVAPQTTDNLLPLPPATIVYAEAQTEARRVRIPHGFYNLEPD